MRCEECERAELLEARRWLALLALVLEYRRYRRLGIYAGMGRALQAALGILPPSHYERHRDEFVRTGEELELRRMLRALDEKEE